MRIASGHDVIITSDLGGRITWISPRAEEAFGYRAEELIGWPLSELLPGGSDELDDLMRRLASDGRVRDYATTFPGSGGRVLAVSWSIDVLRDPNGAVMGAVGVVTAVPA